jgi:NAD(P)-dependent dehydrogenase (short-subunit alcohol dehydrogenase family)
MCEKMKENYKKIDVLLLNAGMYTPNNKKIEYIELPTKKKAELTFAVNHLANFYMLQEILPLLKSSSSPRIIHVSSIAHNNCIFSEKSIEKPKSSYEAYALSKLSNVLFSNALTRKFQANQLNITSNSLHPGIISTNLLSDMGFRGSQSLKEGKSFIIFKNEI